jgi:hypothetical protein
MMPPFTVTALEAGLQVGTPDPSGPTAQLISLRDTYRDICTV